MLLITTARNAAYVRAGGKRQESTRSPFWTVTEDPAERFYHDYTLERITPDNILQIQELSLVNLLPEWFFDPYSEEYQTYHTVTKSWIENDKSETIEK